MNGKKARKLRQLLNLDLKEGSDDKRHGAEAVDAKVIAQIHPDGSLSEREVNVVEARTTEERYLYRELKKVYTDPKRKPEVHADIRTDLNSKSEKADKGITNE